MKVFKQFTTLYNYNKMITYCTTVKTNPNDYQTAYVEQLQEMLEQGNLPTAYEVITKDNKNVRPYFDLDLKTNENTKEPEYYLENAKEFLDKHFPNADYAISGSNRSTKISYHIIISNFLTTIQDLKNLAEVPEFKECHLDPMVYRIDNSKFRLIGTKGEKLDSVAKTAINYEDSINKHLVTYSNEDIVCEQFEFKKIEKKKQVIVKQESMEGNNKLSTLMGLIDANQIDYSDWIKIGLYLKSVDRYDLFNELSSRSQFYDESGLQKQWSLFKPNGSVGIGTIEYYAKKTNPDKYLELNKPNHQHFDYDYFRQLITIDEKVKYFNEYHFWYAGGGCIFEISDLYKTGFKMRPRIEFNDHYSNLLVQSNEEGKKTKMIQFSKVWMEHKDRRNIFNVCFTPYFKEDPLKNDKNSFNIFRGFLHKYDPNFVVDMSLVTPVLDLIDILVEHDPLCKEYLIKYFAHLIQFPGNKIPVGVVFTSLNQGTGKNTIIDFIGEKVIGEIFYNYTNNWEQFTSKFNSDMETCLLQCMDELSSSGAQFKEFNRLKSVLSQKTRRLELKRVNPIQVNDYTRYVFCSNNYSNIVKVEAGDRRWFILNSDNSLANDTDYFDNFYKNVFNVVNGKHFYHYLANLDLSNWNYRKIPMTELKQSLMEKSLPQFLIFLISYYANKKPLEDCIVNDEDDIKLISCVYDDFKQMFPKNQMNSRSFAISLYKLNDGFKTSKIKHGNQKCINMNFEMIKQSIENFTKISPFPFSDWVDFKSSECLI